MQEQGMTVEEAKNFIIAETQKPFRHINRKVYFHAMIQVKPGILKMQKFEVFYSQKQGLGYYNQYGNRVIFTNEVPDLQLESEDAYQKRIQNIEDLMLRIKAEGI